MSDDVDADIRKNWQKQLASGECIFTLQAGSDTVRIQQRKPTSRGEYTHGVYVKLGDILSVLEEARELGLLDVQQFTVVR